MINILRGKESYFIHRTDAFENEQQGCEKENYGKKSSLLIQYHSDVPKATLVNTTPSSGFMFGHQQPQPLQTFGVTSRVATTADVVGISIGTINSHPDSKPSMKTTQGKPDTTSVDEFNNIGFGKNGFEVGNTVPAEIVIEFILEAEKYGCNEFLKIAIPYVAMRNFSYFECIRGFSKISIDTRLKIAMLRLRIVENHKSNGLDIKGLLYRK